MMQQVRLYLIKMLLLFLLFEPINCSSYEHYNRGQDQSPFSNLNPFFNLNYGDAINRQNFEYQPYQPQYTSSQSHQIQYRKQKQKDEIFVQPRLSIESFPSYNIQHRLVPVLPPVSVPPLQLLPLPYQGKPKKTEEELDLEDKIRSIFYVGPEKDLKLFNTSLDPKLSLLDRMHADESYKINDENGTDSSLSKALLSPEMEMPSSSSSSSSSSLSSSSTNLGPTLSSSLSLNDEEPTFKVQRTPDGKLSLVFNDILSLQRPVNPKTRPSLPLPTRPEIIFPSSRSETAFSGCEKYEGQSLCKQVHRYPNLAKLDTILQREFSQMGIFFSEDAEQPFNVSQRFGGDPDEIDPCSSAERTIYPEAGETFDSRWLLIVNDNKSYKQGVRIEQCIGQDQPCDTINEFLPNNYRSICKQSYVFRSLIALTENGTVTKEQFKIPSCCKCVLKYAKRY